MGGVLTRLFKRILDFWCTTESTRSWLTISFFVVLISICACCALVGAVPTFLAGHDNFFFLENGWRVLNGLRPHLDFWSPWGPLTFLLVALGLKLSHNSPDAIAYGTAIFALLIGLWTYGVGRRRLAPLPRALLALYAAAMSCAPYALGWAPTTLSPAMLYNRYGYALLVVILLECFQRLDKTAPGAQEWLGGASTGAAVALALFLKASYFLAGMGLIAASLVVWFPSIRRLVGIVIGFAAVTFLGLAYLRFDFEAMLRALRMAAGARAQTLSLTTPIFRAFGQLLPFLCIVALAVAASFLKTRRPEWLGQLYLPIAAIIVFIGDIALLCTNMQISGLPLLGALALLIANRLADSPSDLPVARSQFGLPYYASVLLLAGLSFAPQFAFDLLALPISAVRKIHPPSGCGARFSDPRVAGLILCDHGDEGDMKWSNGSAYTAYVNDGVDLLHRNANPTDKVLTMDMQNPFPYVLGWLPARGGLASTSFNYTVSARFRPTFDEYFGDATIVMMPRHPAQAPEYFDGFYAIYAPAVEDRFRLAAESDWFRLYKRK